MKTNKFYTGEDVINDPAAVVWRTASDTQPSPTADSLAHKLQQALKKVFAGR